MGKLTIETMGFQHTKLEFTMLKPFRQHQWIVLRKLSGNQSFGHQSSSVRDLAGTGLYVFWGSEGINQQNLHVLGLYGCHVFHVLTCFETTKCLEGFLLG
jgi:hypothetical protein